MGIIHDITRAVEYAGIAIILAGAVAAFVRYVPDRRRIGPDASYRALRANLGRAILLGLELLVAADIINTVAVEPTIDNLAVLGLIVAIRTILSISLEVEIEGRWPWQSATPAPQAADAADPHRLPPPSA